MKVLYYSLDFLDRLFPNISMKILIDENGDYGLEYTNAVWASNQMHQDYHTAKVSRKMSVLPFRMVRRLKCKSPAADTPTGDVLPMDKLESCLFAH